MVKDVKGNHRLYSEESHKFGLISRAIFLYHKTSFYEVDTGRILIDYRGLV